VTHLPSEDAAALDRALRYLQRARAAKLRCCTPSAAALPTWADAEAALCERIATLRALAAKAEAPVRVAA
jgi:hypothetical protein